MGLGKELPIETSKFNDLMRNAEVNTQKTAELLNLIAGRSVTIRVDHNSSFLVDYTQGLPEDFSPCLVTDASGRIWIRSAEYLNSPLLTIARKSLGMRNLKI